MPLFKGRQTGPSKNGSMFRNADPPNRKPIPRQTAEYPGYRNRKDAERGGTRREIAKAAAKEAALSRLERKRKQAQARADAAERAEAIKDAALERKRAAAEAARRKKAAELAAEREKERKIRERHLREAQQERKRQEAARKEAARAVGKRRRRFWS